MRDSGAEELGMYMNVLAFKTTINAQHGSQEGHCCCGPSGRPPPICLLLLCSTIRLCASCTVHRLCANSNSSTPPGSCWEFNSQLRKQAQRGPQASGSTI